VNGCDRVDERARAVPGQTVARLFSLSSPHWPALFVVV
jgi:hypothetical protein